MTVPNRVFSNIWVLVVLSYLHACSCSSVYQTAGETVVDCGDDPYCKYQAGETVSGCPDNDPDCGYVYPGGEDATQS